MLWLSTWMIYKGAFVLDYLGLDQWSKFTTDESVTRVDSSVPLMHHELSDLGSLILIIPKDGSLAALITCFWWVLWAASIVFKSESLFQILGLSFLVRLGCKESCYITPKGTHSNSPKSNGFSKIPEVQFWERADLRDDTTPSLHQQMNELPSNCKEKTQTQLSIGYICNHLIAYR